MQVKQAGRGILNWICSEREIFLQRFAPLYSSLLLLTFLLIQLLT